MVYSALVFLPSILDLDFVYRPSYEIHTTPVHCAVDTPTHHHYRRAGNLDAAEASCSACLAAWPAFAKGQLKMAQILRARGMSAQVTENEKMR